MPHGIIIDHPSTSMSMQQVTSNEVDVLACAARLNRTGRLGYKQAGSGSSAEDLEKRELKSC